MRPAWFAAAAAAAVCLGVGYTLAGALGVVIVVTGLAMLVLLRVREMAGPGVPDSAGARHGGRQANVEAADFPAYRKIAADVGWANVSRRHYDYVVRPLLIRVFTAVLAERHRIDVTAQPEQARRLIGEGLWPLVDPGARRSDDSHAPGVSLAAISRVVDRLEEL
ncbi:MAG: hypothetical protein ACM3ML_39510 [Micromonosporaceae bacterium]